MDLPEFDRAQLHAVEVLRAGGAVVVTNTSPMTYGVVARDAGALNQPGAISVHSEAARDQLLRYLELPTHALAMVDLALAERMSVLAPLRPDPTMPECRTRTRTAHGSGTSSEHTSAATRWAQRPQPANS